MSLLPPEREGSGLISAERKKKRQNESQTYSKWCFLEDLRYKKSEYTAHTVATIIVQTAKYSWCVKMYRPVLA